MFDFLILLSEKGETSLGRIWQKTFELDFIRFDKTCEEFVYIYLEL